MIIYKVVNKINGKCYIGKTIKSLSKRKIKHIYDSNRKSDFVFHKAIRKYGEENFEWKIIKTCNSVDEMDKSEIEYINKFDSFYGNGNGYNMTKDNSSGMRGRNHSKTAKYIQSKKLMGNTHRAREWNILINNEKVTIKNLVKWCRENNYIYVTTKYRIKNGIDLALPKWYDRNRT